MCKRPAKSVDRASLPGRAILHEQREILRRNRLLSELSEAEMIELLALAQTRTYQPQHVVFQKGDPGDRLYAILSGKIAITTVSEQGKEVFLNVLEEGDVLGEIALLDGKERTASALVLERSCLIVIERSDFLPFLKQRPDLCIRLMGVLCERLRWTSMLIEDTIFLDIPHRLAKRLQTLIRQFGHPNERGVDLGLKLSQEDLAHMLGATRESVNKGLRALEESGIISYRRGYMTITDATKLAAFVGQGDGE